MTAPPALLWLRQDLRLHDNPALVAAARDGRAVVAVYVLDDETPGRWALGGASRWWLHHSLAAFAAEFARRGGQLVLRRGIAAREVADLAQVLGVAEVHANALHEPFWRQADRSLAAALAAQGRRLVRHRAATLMDPQAIRTKPGTPFGVYTPFARACLAAPPPRPPLPAPARLPPVAGIAGETLDSLRLLPRDPDWAGGLRATWQPGEAAALARLRHFIDGPVGGYDQRRNLPALAGTSGLSPHLHWGEISPHTVWQAVAALPGEAARVFRSELLWREFAQYLLWHHPHMPERALRPAYDALPWRDDPQALRAWQRGRTGYPIVDAGMRQLWQTGWMHNRVRMIVGSLLVKHLLLDWRAGQDWFWDTLVDADLAANSASWQWVAGTGIDSQPFFRIFNPVSQGERFDPDGEYVTRFVPELAALPARHVHAPWAAPPLLLAQTGTMIPLIYPAPVVELDAGRQRALAAWRGAVRAPADEAPA